MKDLTKKDIKLSLLLVAMAGSVVYAPAFLLFGIIFISVFNNEI